MIHLAAVSATTMYRGALFDKHFAIAFIVVTIESFKPWDQCLIFLLYGKKAVAFNITDGIVFFVADGIIVME
jgi:hypothetical protein